MKLSTRQYSRTTIAALLIVGLVLQSCVRTDTVKPDFLLEHATSDITVVVKSGDRILLREGDYMVLRAESADSLRGKGKKYDRRTQKFDVPFDGAIAFADIEYVRAHEKTPAGKIVEVGTAIILVSLVSFLIFAIYWVSTHKGH